MLELYFAFRNLRGLISLLVLLNFLAPVEGAATNVQAGNLFLLSNIQFELQLLAVICILVLRVLAWLVQLRGAVPRIALDFHLLTHLRLA